MYFGEHVKQEPQPSAHHCVSVCLTLKKESHNINGVMIKERGLTFDCWCIKNAGKVRKRKQSGYESCIVNMKCEYFMYISFY